MFLCDSFRQPVGVSGGTSVCLLLCLPAQHRLPVQSERGRGAALHLPVSREDHGGGANRPPVARHHKVSHQPRK